MQGVNVQGKTRKRVALGAVLVLAVLAWFTMDVGGTAEQAHVGWFTVDSNKIRIAAVLIILSFGFRIVLMERLSARDADRAAELESAAEVDTEE
jgi:small neutral amino acid transporter SnatA (MarC family)